MDINRLYPPSIAGTIPSFYTTNTGTSLEVPFSMNTTVSDAAVSGMRLRLKTTSTDIILANLISTKYREDAGSRSVIFEFDADLVKKLVVGNFYKVQLAYIDKNDLTGYYSTVGIVKYTQKPSVSILGLNMQSTTTISNMVLVGNYFNSDTTEKVYKYRFKLFGPSGEVVQDTDWQIHNVQTDTALDTSQDQFTIAYNLIENRVYRVVYSVTTINGLVLNTVSYEIVRAIAMGSQLNIVLKPELDYANGRIQVSIFAAPGEKGDYPLVGTYAICRRKADNDSQIWETLAHLSLNLTITQSSGYSFYDYAIESGVQYYYSIQKFNSNKIYSQRITHKEPIAAYFEHAFLYDGQRQLKIEYNPQVNSFKAVVAETKKTTLGRQFPFILRNGLLNYKEFPIGGLISYHLDQDELFVSKRLLESKWDDSLAGFNLTDDNIVYERKFKMEVLEWLNNGEIKLFKSPQEGNYIVRLTNVSLSPNATTSRMIHTFTCTASEVSAYDSNASLKLLGRYEEITEEKEDIRIEKEIVIDLHQVAMQLGSAQMIRFYDLLDGYRCRKIVFQHNLDLINTMYRDSTYGMTFDWGEYSFTIDRSGLYTLELDQYSAAPLYYNIDLEKNIETVRGFLTLTVEALETDNLDIVHKSLIQPLCGMSIYGADEDTSVYTINPEEPNYLKQRRYSRNLLENYNNLKTTIGSVEYIQYWVAPVYNCGQNSLSETWTVLQNKLLIPPGLVYGTKVFLKTPDGQYWVYRPDPSHYIKDEKTSLYPEPQDDWFQPTSYNTSIIFGDTELDVATVVGSATSLNIFNSIPYNSKGEPVLRVQNGVNVMIFGTMQTQTYTVEEVDPIVDSTKAFEAAYENYCKLLFNFESIDWKNIRDNDNNYIYIFQDRQFIEIVKAQSEDYATAGYTLYRPHWENGVYSKAEIQAAYDNYIAKQKQLVSQLEAVLE